MSEEAKKNNYDASSIQALEGMEHVRMRPSMY
ncbi:MAG: DNA gyrase subunit B, partial [Urechidicola sp.]